MTLAPSHKKIKKSLEHKHSIEERAEGMLIEETPELLAAIDEGLRSAEMEECVQIEVVRAELKKKWATL